MPSTSLPGTYDRTRVFIATVSMYTSFPGPDLKCFTYSFMFSCVPQPISAGSAASSMRPTQDHVHRNSPTFFGSLEIWVSRSEM
ncbi:hypothetical protein ATCV1_z592R [Acanthocystis turfacea chlorella virus 1]|uniref:Uncharacterized protein z592R n=1 Tax=Chlorovirus heliozoae TaxID=322019 RepID=A7K9K2_9PHYC|nr:hypothetical protein ATCV1_z592R [Acanthocystis turfacea chlorella virus 1]ABT16726.1 hypothetical protein ATCV1_z592R [Acanthocystis turfacea chlorella virus 1]